MNSKNRPQVIYIQNSVHLAGAQKSLSRILASKAIADYNPILVASSTGWLTEFAESIGVDVISTKFPSSRSVAGRFWGNESFARKIRSKVRAIQRKVDRNRPLIIHGNDHPDSLLTYQISKMLSARSVITLRTPNMSRRDFFKYQCDRHEAIVSVGDHLFQEARSYAPGRHHALVYNGVTDEEFYPVGNPKPSPISRVLVLGAADERKGWQDLFDALFLLEQSGKCEIFPEFVFLGEQYGIDMEEHFKSNRLKKFKVKFMKQVQDYADVIRSFPLVIHTSRNESFGMAALETVAAGVPLLAADTGMIRQFVENEDFLFPSGDTISLADRLIFLFRLSQIEINQSFAPKQRQARVKSRFSTTQTLASLTKIYDSGIS